MDRAYRFLPTWLIIGFLLISLAHAQNRRPVALRQNPGTLSGTWQLVAENHANGKAPSSTANINNVWLTITGESTGKVLLDQPMIYGNDGKIEISCRGTVTFSFTVSRLAGVNVIHEGVGVEVAGKDCRQMAGTTKKSDEDHSLFEMDGDTLRIIDASVENGGKNSDLEILTYRRVLPPCPRPMIDRKADGALFSGDARDVCAKSLGLALNDCACAFESKIMKKARRKSFGSTGID